LTAAAAQGAMASTLGAALGIGLGFAIVSSGRRQFSQLGVRTEVSPGPLVAAILLGTAITAVAAWAPARRAGRLDPAAAIVERPRTAAPRPRRGMPGLVVLLAGAAAITAAATSVLALP